MRRATTQDIRYHIKQAMGENHHPRDNGKLAKEVWQRLHTNRIVAHQKVIQKEIRDVSVWDK